MIKVHASDVEKLRKKIEEVAVVNVNTSIFLETWMKCISYMLKMPWTYQKIHLHLEIRGEVGCAHMFSEDQDLKNVLACLTTKLYNFGFFNF